MINNLFGNNFNGASFGIGSQATKLKYCCDLDKTVLAQNFEKRGWISVNPDEDWNFYWYE
jgi:hypothetical protein